MELQLAHKHIEELTNEIMKLKKKCGTFRSRSLVQSQSNSPPACDRDNQKPLYLINPPALSTIISTSRPAKATHPGIKFWTRQEFYDWLDSTKQQDENYGKEPYLEEEDGSRVEDTRLTIIRQTMRSGFSELRNINRAPRVWGDLDATGRQFFHSYMESNFPLFMCAEAGWKLDRLARSMYPSWRARRTDKNGSWVAKVISRKRSVNAKDSLRPKKLSKVAVTMDSDPKVDTAIGTSSSSALPDSMNPESDEFLYASGESPPPGPSIPIDPTLVEVDTSITSDNQVHGNSTSGSASSAMSPTSANAVNPGSSTMSSTSGTRAVTPSVDLSTQAPSDSSKSVSESAAPAKLQHRDPLRHLASVAATLGINIPAPEKPTGTAATATINTNTSNRQPFSATPTAEHSQAPSTVGHKGKKGGAKLRPGKAKNGRNLCGKRWLKAFKHTTNQSTEEFKEYYDALSQEQKEAYDKEAVDLAAKDWSKDPDIPNGTMY